MTLTVKVSGMHNPFRSFNWAGVAARWVEQVEPLVKDRLREAAPVGQGPGAGRLRDSIRSEYRISAASVALTFTAHTPYAGFVIEGTRPHEIRPRNAQVLHWTGPEGSVFARLVHHPGTKPNPFAERAIRPLEVVIKARLKAAIAAQMNP